MRLILDLDNVFIDFIRAIQALHGTNIPYMECTCDMAHLMFPDDHRKFWAPVTQEWWATLPWTPEGKEFYTELLMMFETDNICIATAPPEAYGKYVYGTGYYDGRMQWIEENMPEIKHISLTKSKFFKATPVSILIDDLDHHCESFIKKGGRAFTPSRPWNRYASRETFNVDTAIKAISHMVRG